MTFVPRGRSRRLCDAARLARAAAGFGLTKVARHADVRSGDLVRFLGSLPARGRCAEAARITATRWGTSASGARNEAITVASPPVRRVLAGRAGTASSGTAGWRARRVGEAPPACVIRGDLTDARQVLLGAAPDHDPVNSSGCPPAALTRLAASARPEIRSRLARSLRCPPAALAALTCDPQESVRVQALSNPTFPASTLTVIASRWWPQNTPPDVRLDTHSSDGHSYTRDVRRAVAAHRNLPPGLAERALNDPDARVRAAAARNPSLPQRCLVVLARNADPEIRQNAATNKSCDIEVLNLLASDPEPAVREAAATNAAAAPHLAERLSRDPHPDVKRAAAANPSLPPARIKQLASSRNWMTRCHTAYNPSCPPELLSRLSNDTDWSVRRAVASNQACPPLTLQRLAGDLTDTGEAIRAAVAQNPSCPTNTLVVLSGDEQPAVAELALANLRRLPSQART